jgi:UDP-N-acetylmuramoylalanine--D-glutamate ligase
MLKPLVKAKVKALVCLGLDNSKIEEAFNGLVPEVFHTLSMNDAVQKAYSVGNPGDAVLLSPACASFDLFENFEERGKSFKAAVRDL